MRGKGLVVWAATVLWSGAALAETALEAVSAADRKFEQAFNRGDAAAVAAMYTPDGAVLPPGAPRADGREAIERFWRGAIDAGVGDITLRPEEVAESGDLAYEVGSATLRSRASGAPPVSVKYVVVWRRGQDGAWRLHRDIRNPNPQAAG
jgi:uncharacterized protein (TIGR02246 family)